MNLKKNALLAALTPLALGGICAPAMAHDGPWGVRVRAVQLESANKDTTPLGLSVNDKTIPEVDISYYFAPNLAAELVLTVPQKHTLYSGATAIGSLKHLPPTLSLQYLFSPEGYVRPYVGAGLNYTRFSSVNFAPAVVTALDPSIKKSSVGLSVGAGLDVEISPGLFLNVDVKKVQIGTDVSSKGSKVGEFKVNPTLYGVGLGWRF